MMMWCDELGWWWERKGKTRRKFSHSSLMKNHVLTCKQRRFSCNFHEEINKSVRKSQHQGRQQKNEGESYLKAINFLPLNFMFEFYESAEWIRLVKLQTLHKTLVNILGKKRGNKWVVHSKQGGFPCELWKVG